MPKARPRLKLEGIRIEIECRACGWRWVPQPRLWRNRRNPTSNRTLRCPSCGIPNRIRAEDVARIWKYNY